MSNKNYIVYHLHSKLSNGITNIDSVTDYKDYIKRAKECGMKSLGFAEHGCVLEWVHKKQEIEKNGMKYIHASEFYVTEEMYEYPDVSEMRKATLGLAGEELENSQKEIEEYLEKNKSLVKDNYHCVLIARNYNGVKELNRLSSKSFRKDGHRYYRPRITLDELISTSENIIVTTACIGGILASGKKTAQEKFLKFLCDNKHRCFLEIQHHCDDFQIQYNRYLARISYKYGIPLIAGTDTHALNEKHMMGRAILQKSKEVSFDSESSWNMKWLTYDELVSEYEKQCSVASDVYLQAIENTNVMADMIEEFELDYSKKYPKLYDDSDKVFKNKIVEGIRRRGINKLPNYNEYKERINYELDTYNHNGAVDFMLLEEDYKTALTKQGVDFGWSRGSVSGSEIAYLLGITEIDSVKHGLNFERFMNKERVSLAD